MLDAYATVHQARGKNLDYVAGQPIMDVMHIVATLYLSIATFAVVMTYREQKQSGLKSPVFNMIGFTLCVLWPVVVAAFLHARTRQQPE